MWLGKPTVKVLTWAEDVDPTKGMQDEQILVTRKNEVSLARKSKREELIVFGIATCGDGGNALDESRFLSHIVNETQSRLEAKIRLEFRTQQNVFQLGERLR